MCIQTIVIPVRSGRTQFFKGFKSKACERAFIYAVESVMLQSLHLKRMSLILEGVLSRAFLKLVSGSSRGYMGKLR